MVNFKSALASFAVLPLVSALIGGVDTTPVNYTATTTSTIPWKVTSGWTKVNFFDLTVSFGVAAVSDHIESNLGWPVKANLDLWALNSTYISENKTFNVPLVQSDFYKGAGEYVFTAVIGHASGLFPALTHFTSVHHQNVTVTFA